MNQSPYQAVNNTFLEIGTFYFRLESDSRVSGRGRHFEIKMISFLGYVKINYDMFVHF